MTIDPFRFLGLAFAAADLLFEVAPDGVLTFAAGATQSLAGSDGDALVGRSWQAMFNDEDQMLVEAMLTGLQNGERRGPSVVRLAGADSRQATLAVFLLPQNAPRVSGILTMTHRGGERPAGGGLRDRDSFEAIAHGLVEAARHGGVMLELSLIELSGLTEERDRLSDEDGALLDRRIAGALRAEAHGDAAAELGGERFAVLRKSGEPPEIFAQRLTRILGAALAPNIRAMAVDSLGSGGRIMRALRFALDTFVSNGIETPTTTLSEMLDQSVQTAVDQASAFGALVKSRRFRLVYQPVVSLKDRSIHHHETLVRFEGDRSPFAMIRMAEELDIIEDLDRAVAEMAAKRLREDLTRKLRLAINVSGRTIVSPGFVEGITRLAEGGALAGRLIFEVTETAAIDDFKLAQRHIQALQALKFQVCLDDFGSGAASFAYLQQLKVDVVKIDGSYVRELTSSGRDDAMIRHLVQLCKELGVTTVAEMVETQPVADALERAGVDYAQGWLYSQPTAEPISVLKGAGPAAARRQGEVEQWS